MLNTGGIHVQREYLAPLAEEMYQIAPVSASSIKNAHIRCDVPSQNLIEYVDINLSKLLLHA